MIIDETIGEFHFRSMNAEDRDIYSLVDAPEVEIIQSLIDENAQMSSRAETVVAVESGKNAVRVYRV